MTGYKPEQRIISLDVLRGIALLGILLMNINSFSAPFVAYANPTAFGDFDGSNFWVWCLGHVFAEQKFMAIFSILFGAGAHIFYTRANEKGLNAKLLHQRRMRWLILFGLVHAYLIWYGDILFGYALCGLFVIKFIDTESKKLLMLSAALLLVPVVLTLLMQLGVQGQEGAEASMKYWAPDPQLLQTEIQHIQGSWLETRIFSATNALVLQSFGFVFYTFWRVTALMLIGIVMLRTGFITAKFSPASYKAVAIVGLSVGVSISVIGVQQNIAHGFELQYSSYLGTLFNYLGSLFTAVAYIALVMLLVQSQAMVVGQRLLANVGRMAFTNYIMQSVICSVVFYGFGLGYFAQLDRLQCLIVVLIVWSAQLFWSTFWLSKFKQGPLEMLWRHLTYR